jgi:hypothetical protein
VCVCVCVCVCACVCVCVCVCVREDSRSQSLLIFVRLESKIKKLNRDMTSGGQTSVVPCQRRDTKSRGRRKR